MDGGAAQLHALLAAAAIGLGDREGCLGLDRFEQDAGTAGNDDAGALGGKLLGQHTLAGGEIVGIDHAHAVNAHRMAECLQVYLCGGVAVDVVARGGVLLMSRHTRDGVVQDDDGGIGSIVSDVDKTGHARMHEGGVTDDGHGATLAGLAADLVEAVHARDRCAHTKHRIHGVERLCHAEGVATDVTDDGDLVFRQGVEETSVGASCTHNGGTDGDLLVGGDTLAHVQTKHAADEVLGELALHGEEVLAVHRKTEGAAMVLDDGIQLFDDHEAVNASGKFLDQGLGQGVDHTQLEDGCLVAKDLLDVAVASTRADDTERGVTHFHTVEGRRLGICHEAASAGLYLGVAANGVGRSHDELLGVLLVGLDGHVHAILHRDQALGVCNAGAHAQQNGGVKFLGESKSGHSHLACLGGVGGLQHGHLGGDGVVAGILLVLRGVHTGIVGHAQYKTAVDAGVGHGVKGVGGHVQTNVLHGASRARACERCTEGDLKGDLLVGCPFAPQVGAIAAIFGGKFGDFGGGRSGVAGNEAATCLVQTAGNGLVAEHKLFFHGLGPFPM